MAAYRLLAVPSIAAENEDIGSTTRNRIMPRLYSYVVDHDHVFAPCPFDGFCTLAKCKYGTKKRNIVEMAEVGDWIGGTGGVKAEERRARHADLRHAGR